MQGIGIEEYRNWIDLIIRETLESGVVPQGIIHYLKLIYYFTYFSPLSHPTLVCLFSVGLSLLIQHFQQVLWVLGFLLSPGLGSGQLELKSLIIVTVGFM
jgi:hypothetical protein